MVAVCFDYELASIFRSSAFYSNINEYGKVIWLFYMPPYKGFLEVLIKPFLSNCLVKLNKNVFFSITSILVSQQLQSIQIITDFNVFISQLNQIT